MLWNVAVTHPVVLPQNCWKIISTLSTACSSSSGRVNFQVLIWDVLNMASASKRFCFFFCIFLGALFLSGKTVPISTHIFYFPLYLYSLPCSSCVEGGSKGLCGASLPTGLNHNTQPSVFPGKKLINDQWSYNLTPSFSNTYQPSFYRT